MSTKQARTLTRGDAPLRAPPAGHNLNPNRVVPPEERDPNKTYSRDGREVTLRYTGDEDRFNLANLGVYPEDGWTYEWKTKTIKNWEWVDHQVELYQNGWTPVPAERHDGKIMPPGHVGNIERGGMILMERDARLTARARAMDKRKADSPVQDSRQMAGLMSRVSPNAADVIDFDHGAARGATGVRVDRQPRVAGGAYTYEE
jgi:hypothetical protein